MIEQPTYQEIKDVLKDLDFHAWCSPITEDTFSVTVHGKRPDLIRYVQELFEDFATLSKSSHHDKTNQTYMYFNRIEDEQNKSKLDK